MEALLKLLTLMSSVALAAPASAERLPSQPADIAGAVADCWAAVRPNAVDQAVLRQRGWQVGTIKAADGAVATPLQLFGKHGSNVIVMLMGAEETPMCSVVSPVESVEAVSKAAQAVQRALVAADPQVKTARSGKSIVFLALPKSATLDATGTKN